jgi:ABC-2 type transport system ATP-binding protein
MFACNANGDGDDFMQPGPSALEVRRLTKRFDRPAVDSLDLTVRAGEFYALVGPNGAGKTTTLRMVACCGPTPDWSQSSASTRYAIRSPPSR